MSETIIDECLTAAKETGKTYPDGYGFALAYLRGTKRDDFNPAWLRDCARRIVARAFEDGGRPICRTDRDLIRYIVAQEKIGWEYWLIEAAQLVHAAALNGDKEAARVMALCGHPGFDA